MAAEIWTGMLQMELEGASRPAVKTNGIGACVHISGAWQGAVLVHCSLELARLATARFLAVDPGEIAIEQMRDAMGELANMSAGSVKPLLPEPCQLSLPSVADGTDYHLSVPQGTLLLESTFQCGGEPLSITVLQRRDGRN